ncbi:helix-turn-helix transcriptional regulator [Kiritimatiellota bacterium B12222]|nr:helix-turn-helix transcriptional regulator [Kiritimatiellota bacterium B12222]
MAKILYRLSSLLPPITQVVEFITTVPAGERVEVGGGIRPRIIFFLKGGLELRLPGGIVQTLNEGDAISYLNPHHLEYYSTDPEQDASLHTLQIRFDLEAIDTLLASKTSKRHPSLHFYEDLKQRLSGFHHFPGALHPTREKELVKFIREEAQNRNKIHSGMISGLALALTASVTAIRPSPIDETPLSQMDRGKGAAEHARQYILQRYHQKLTLGQIAWSVQLSGEHLERLFNRHFGTSVIATLYKIRLEHAKEELVTTDLPVFQIASRCGFSSSTLLGRHLKRDTGQSPLSYRLSAREHESFHPSVFRRKETT